MTHWTYVVGALFDEHQREHPDQEQPQLSALAICEALLSGRKQDLDLLVSGADKDFLIMQLGLNFIGEVNLRLFRTSGEPPTREQIEAYLEDMRVDWVEHRVALENQGVIE